MMKLPHRNNKSPKKGAAMPPRRMARASVLPEGKTLAKAEFTSAKQEQLRGGPVGRAACHGEIAAQGDNDALTHDETTSQKQ